MSDTSEKYRKMADCPEIQGLKIPRHSIVLVKNCWAAKRAFGIVTGKDHVGGYNIFLKGNNHGSIDRKYITYYPRQDDLWGWWKGKPCELRYDPILKWDMWVPFLERSHIFFHGDTPEQALIQGVMHELHKKKWDNEKGWIAP